MASADRLVVEHSPNHPKLKSLSSAVTAGNTREKFVEKSSLTKLVTRVASIGRVGGKTLASSSQVGEFEFSCHGWQQEREKKLATRLASAGRVVVEHSPHYPSWRV